MAPSDWAPLATLTLATVASVPIFTEAYRRRRVARSVRAHLWHVVAENSAKVTGIAPELEYDPPGFSRNIADEGADALCGLLPQLPFFLTRSLSSSIPR